MRLVSCGEPVHRGRASLAVARRETLTAALVATVAAAVVAVLSPPGGDTAAHLYRIELVRDGVLLWDNHWFAGHYPLASYSVLYYLPAALLGNEVLVGAASVISAALFAAIARDEWGAAARGPALAFAVLIATPLFTGTYSFAVGLTAGLGALRLLQLERPWLALACAALTVGFSPLSFVFLGIVLVAALAARRRIDRRTVAVGAGLAALAAVQLAAVVVVFPSVGRYTYSPLSLSAALTVSTLGAALAYRAERARVLAWLFALWAAISLTGFLVASPFGDTLTRMRIVVFPLMLLTAAIAGFRPRPLAAVALAFALVYNVAPELSALPKRIEDARTAEEAFWAPALDFVRPRTSPEFRVEVVPTFGHWEAYWVPRSSMPLARGWYRQIDLAENPELYRDPLDPDEYVGRLRELAVRFVLVPDARLGALGASREAALARSGLAGLREVFRNPDWRVYEVPDATPLLDGGRIERLAHDAVAGHVDSPGEHRLRIRFTRYWRPTGPVCVERAPDGMTLLRATRAGRFELRASLLDWRRCGRV